uniref:Lipocalin n=1 Tax=Rhipicephalus zambeziensis TaxID=60191 RepID=A0A224YCA9_9ACAR
MVFLGIAFVLAMTIVTFLNVPNSSEGYRHPILEELQEALRSDQVSGLKMRSYAQHGRDCFYVTNTRFNGTEGELDIGYRKEGKYTTDRLYCKLGEGNKGPVMTVRRGNRTAPAVNYTLGHLDIEENCAIFMVKVNGREECEQYVSSINIDNPVPQCDEVYRSICKQRQVYNVYERSCQDSG